MPRRATSSSMLVAPGFDSTLALMRDPYRFISSRYARLGEEMFETRVLLRKTICLTGHDAAQVFYDPDRFQRRGAAPARLQKTLFGENGVQGLDGAAHRHRKSLFLDIITPDTAKALGDIADECWHARAEQWQRMDEVELYRATREVLCEAVCRWAGVPLSRADIPQRAGQLSRLYESAGAVGPEHWRGRLARTAAERWIAHCIVSMRAGVQTQPSANAAELIACHRDESGVLLDPEIAAVELLNVLRPTIAVSVYIVYVALALHTFPHCAQQLRHGPDAYADWFVQEVRRYYPFFPAVMAIVRRRFEWHGYTFEAGRRALLDLYGINHDPRLWDSPGEFRPERFSGWQDDGYSLVPQGGGEVTGHRCPGEPIAIELMKRAARFLTRRIRYATPAQDLRIDFKRLPASPRRYVITDVRVTS